MTNNMKSKTIKDNTFKTYIELFWDCTESEFCEKHNEVHYFKVSPAGSFGKTILTNGEYVDVKLWINRRNNVETLSHEILHAVRFWLQDYHSTPLSEETEETYTMLHSYFMGESLRALGLKNLTAK